MRVRIAERTWQRLCTLAEMESRRLGMHITSSDLVRKNLFTLVGGENSVPCKACARRGWGTRKEATAKRLEKARKENEAWEASASSWVQIEGADAQVVDTEREQLREIKRLRAEVKQLRTKMKRRQDPVDPQSLRRKLLGLLTYGVL